MCQEWEGFEWHAEEFECYVLCLEEASKKCIQGMFLIKVEESEKEQNRG